MPQSKSTKLELICTLLVAIAILNFFSFVLIAGLLGGDALNGQGQAGHYFLGNHGKLTEVTRSIFVYSMIHARSLFVTHPLGIIAGLVLWFARKNKERVP